VSSFFAPQELRVCLTMRFILAAFAASMVGSAIAHPGSPHADAQGRYTLEAEGIKAQFIPYGATLTNMWVKGKRAYFHRACTLTDVL
jgi:hypothetical protein